jgi:hypothetical protein
MTAMYRSNRPARSVGSTKKHVHVYQKYNHGPKARHSGRHQHELGRLAKSASELHGKWNGSDTHYRKLEQIAADAERIHAKLARDE